MSPNIMHLSVGDVSIFSLGLLDWHPQKNKPWSKPWKQMLLGGSFAGGLFLETVPRVANQQEQIHWDII